MKICTTFEIVFPKIEVPIEILLYEILFRHWTIPKQPSDDTKIRVISLHLTICNLSGLKNTK